MSADTNRLVQGVRLENAKWRSRHHLYLCVLGTALAAWSISLAASVHSHSPMSPFTHIYFLLLLAVCGREGFGLLSRPTRQHRRVMLSLSEGNETALIGPLLESRRPALVAGEHIFRSDTKLYFAVNSALARLLPLLTPAEYRALTRREKKALFAMLTSEFREVALPAIEAVTRLGDTSAVPVLEEVVRRNTKAETARVLREVVTESLRVLQNVAGP